jgi:hypothetical protein
MLNVFSNLRVYAGKWNLTNSRAFTEEEIDAVDEAFVVPSTYGNSVCFMMKSGGKTFIPLDNSSTLGTGESVDLSKAKLLTLSKAGEADILRVSI